MYCASTSTSTSGPTGRRNEKTATTRPAPGRATGMETGLKGKVALVTGAAHGQGRATALALAAEGAHIAALDVAKKLPYPGYGLGASEDLLSLARECEAKGVRCLTFAADVRD